ncbi:hypothetical protein BD289DRAFT_452014 [Coniella lustricola]|uniref:Aminotransferase n=1 Tax=Coniella lustricola TaxID=2025994 RepID=A0A2T3ACL2_9PEZI|nr:hypothetical protein BD289DRAFT_452014 [Coniella lustricola]
MTDTFQLFTSIRFDWSLASTADEVAWDVGWNSKNASPFYMLDLHRDRLLRGARHWGWTGAVNAIEGEDGLARLDDFLQTSLKQSGRWDHREQEQQQQQQPLRLKIILAQDGKLTLESYPASNTSLSNLFPGQLPAPNSSKDGRSSPDRPRDLDNPLQTLELSPVYDVYVDDATTSSSAFTHFKTTRRDMYDAARERVGLQPTDVTKEVLIVDEETGLIMEGSLTTPYFWRGGRWVTPLVSDSHSSGQVWAGSGGQNGTTRRWALERGIAEQEAVEASSVVDGEAVWLSNGVRGFIFGRVRLAVA